MWSLLSNARASRIEALAGEQQQHQHDHHQLIICLQGQARLALNNDARELAPGQGCLVPGQCPHAFHGDDDNRQIIIDISANAQQARIDERLLAQLFRYPRFFRLDDQQQALLNALVFEIEHYHHDIALQQHASALLLHSLFHRLIPLQQHPATSTPVNGSGAANRIDLALIDQLILDHLAEKLSVEQLASACHMSVSQFHLRFRQLTNQTPHQYLLQQRLQQALWLLQNTTLTVAAIAADTGFANQSALNHALKARYQLSPGQLRKKTPKL